MTQERFDVGLFPLLSKFLLRHYAPQPLDRFLWWMGRPPCFGHAGDNDSSDGPGLSDLVRV